jgi:hypothetical protein
MVWRFVEMADAQGGRAAFYQVRPENLPLYIDVGLRPLKLGEAARVPLDSFSLTGKSRQPLRSALNRAEREGLSFGLVPAAGVPALMDELAEVSRQWLEQHKAREKAFSLGAFEPGYVAAGPVGVVRGPDGAIIAFATLMETPEVKAEMSIDLMPRNRAMASSTWAWRRSRAWRRIAWRRSGTGSAGWSSAAASASTTSAACAPSRRSSSRSGSPATSAPRAGWTPGWCWPTWRRCSPGGCAA